MTDSRKYIEAAIHFSASSAEGPIPDGYAVSDEEICEIITATISDLPYDSFSCECGVLRCYIQESLFSKTSLEEALSDLPWLDFTLEINHIEAKNWNSEWEESFESVRVGEDVEVRSPFAAPDGTVRYDIIISPDMAFGTGSHATTEMMIRWMVLYEKRITGSKVCDIGCGSGVLAILAARMGASAVMAADIDAAAADSALRNVARNGVAGVEVLCSDVSSLDCRKCGIILANIHRNIIIQEMPRFAEALENEGLAFFSGF